MTRRLPALVLLLLTLLLASGCAAATTTPATTTETPGVARIEGASLADPTLVRWIGRTAYDADALAMRFWYAATGFTVRFTGTELAIRIVATNTGSATHRPYFTVSIDTEEVTDGTVVALTSPTSDVFLASGLEEGEHVLTFLKRSEPIDAETAVLAITTDGAFLAPTPAPSLRVLVLGGSGASGHGVLGGPGVARTTANSDVLHSFGFLFAHDLGADSQFVTASGWGLKWGYNPTNRNGTVNIRQAFERFGIDDDQELVDLVYDVSSWVPDYVVVNLGGNDFDAYVSRLEGAAVGLAKAQFRAAVVELCTRLHDLYPDAWVLWTHTGSQNGTEAEAAIGDLDPKHDFIRVVVLPDPGDDGDPLGSGGHYGVLTHRRAADLLLAAVADLD